MRAVLAEMRIEGLGVIDEATLELDPGLTVVTGETGAGKTMVVTGLHLLSGGRAEVSKIRSGAAKAVVEGRFAAPPGSAAAKVASDAGAEPDEDGTLIALRSRQRRRAVQSAPRRPVGAGRRAVRAVRAADRRARAERPAQADAPGRAAVRARPVRRRGAGAARSPSTARCARSGCGSARELTERAARSREMAREADLLKHGLAEIEAVAPAAGRGRRAAGEGQAARRRRPAARVRRPAPRTRCRVRRRATRTCRARSG